MHIQDVLLNLLLKQPFYGYFAASVTPVESTETPTVNMVTIPSLKLLYNKEWFESLKDEQAIGTVIHELLHMILLHPYRKGSRERNLWVVACDMAVNEHIDPRLLPEGAITVAAISDELKESIPRLKSAEFYYEVLNTGDPQLSFSEKDKQITVVLESGQELKANNSTEAEASEVNKNAVRSMLSELLDQAGSEGEVPRSIESHINKIYNSARVNWRNVLKRYLSGKGKVRITKTVKRESKRFENLPGSKRTIGTTALLAIDESGSISEKNYSIFVNELISIKRLTGADISVTRFDTACTDPVPIERFIRSSERLKNGGTDFKPVFELADRTRIPLLIIFTDGDGPAPESVNQKVLWVLTKNGKKPADYGHAVYFEE